MKKSAWACLFLGAAIALPLAANADTFTYSFSGTALDEVTQLPDVSLSFDLTLTATPISGNEFGVTEIASSDFMVNGVTLPSFDESVSYTTSGTLLPPPIYFDAGAMYYDNLYSSVSPNFDINGISFTDGNVDVVVYHSGSDNALFTLATPEPSSYLLALSGLAGILGLAIYRRKTVWNS